MRVLIPAKDSNKSLPFLFIKSLLLQKHQWTRVSLISCNSFVRSIFVGLNSNSFLFYTILDCILVRVYCSKHDPIYLILAEKFCFTIVKIEFFQKNYFNKMRLMNKLILIGFNNKIKANAAINAKLQLPLLVDSCSILDSLWKSDHRMSHHTHKSLN